MTALEALLRGSVAGQIEACEDWGDGFVDNPGGQTIRAGDMVRYLPVRELL